MFFIVINFGDTVCSFLGDSGTHDATLLTSLNRFGEDLDVSTSKAHCTRYQPYQSPPEKIFYEIRLRECGEVFMWLMYLSHDSIYMRSGMTFGDPTDLCRSRFLAIK